MFAHKVNLILKSSYFWVLRVLAKLWKATISLVVYSNLFSCPSVCPHETTRLPLDRFA